MNTKPRGSLIAGVLGASLLLTTAGTAFAAGPTSTPPSAPSPGPWNMMNGTCTDGQHRMSDRAMAGGCAPDGRRTHNTSSGRRSISIVFANRIIGPAPRP